jgi:hypothetical protein
MCVSENSLGTLRRYDLEGTMGRGGFLVAVVREDECTATVTRERQPDELTTGGGTDEYTIVRRCAMAHFGIRPAVGLEL